MNKNSQLTCYLKSPAQENKANDELLSSLAKKLGISRTNCIIIKGQTNRLKTVLIKDQRSIETIYQALGISYQSSI